VILTVKPVRGEDARIAGLLRADAGPTGSAAEAEYVVRTDDGATVAIVQAADPALRPGASVTIGRGEQATLAAR
jgi:outer membrane lipoprotein SlyB